MKKINPKDLEVNPKMRGSNSNSRGGDTTGNTGLINCESYACRTDAEECDTEAGVCYHVTEKTGCMCDTEVDCNYTKVNCPDPTSKGIVCVPLSDRPTDCVLQSRNCVSKEICPVTEVFTECESDCMCPMTEDEDGSKTKCGCAVTVVTDGSCAESVDVCIMSVDCID